MIAVALYPLLASVGWLAGIALAVGAAWLSGPLDELPPVILSEAKNPTRREDGFFASRAQNDTDSGEKLFDSSNCHSEPQRGISGLGRRFLAAARNDSSSQSASSCPGSAPPGGFLIDLLTLDPVLQGFQAIVLCALGWHFGWSLQLAAYGALSAILTLVLFIDLRTRFVYGIVAYPGILAGIILTPLVRGGPWWEGAVSALLGALVFGAMYLLGRVLYRGGEPLATGDITIGTLVGSIVGLENLAPAIFYGVILSGLLALVWIARKRSLDSFLPYGPGLCLGALLALLR